MSFYLECSSCGKEYGPKNRVYSCEGCGGKLEIKYPYDSLQEEIDRETLEKRNLSLWKYFELLPISKETRIISLGEGNTSLRKCKKLSDRIGIKNLNVKNETNNPTGTFKDRSATVGVSKAAEFGAKGIVVASDGNVAPATSAYSSMAGLKCFVFVPDYMPPTRITQTILYGAEVFVVRGDINKCIDLADEVRKKYKWHHLSTVASVNPYHTEGSKTMVYEICEQLGWETPDWIVVPVGGGGLLTANWKGLKEFSYLGLIENLPKIAGVQSEGCAPVVKAYGEGGLSEIKKWEGKIDTEAIPIAVPYPMDGPTALDSIRDSGGTALAVSDEEILAAQKLLAETEAIIAEPAGVASLAGTIKLFEKGVIDENDSVVFEVTGSGLRELQKTEKVCKKPTQIEPKIELVENKLLSEVSEESS